MGTGLCRMGILAIVIVTIPESFRIIICHRSNSNSESFFFFVVYLAPFQCFYLFVFCCFSHIFSMFLSDCILLLFLTFFSMFLSVCILLFFSHFFNAFVYLYLVVNLSNELDFHF